MPVNFHLIPEKYETVERVEFIETVMNYITGSTDMLIYLNINEAPCTKKYQPIINDLKNVIIGLNIGGVITAYQKRHNRS